MTSETDTDILIVGGGINGCGIARDAAGRGLRVTLVEKDDIASHTSSWSTKLIHGGLRYLENYEFAMVREALSEREVLMRIAPHIVWPLRFVLPHEKHLRPAWMIRLGLFLYDHLGRREKLPGSGTIDLQTHPAGKALKPGRRLAFTYSDCATLDSRLTLLNAMAARELGATVLTRTACIKAQRRDKHWQVQLQDAQGREQSLTARALVNSTGPWVRQFMDEALGGGGSYGIRLVQGSHIIVPKMFDHGDAYIFQNSDQRIVFAIPYETDFTLIGTTDVDYHGDPQQPRITEQETDYLCNLVNDYFARPISAADVVASFSGVRPLFDDASASASKVTREYVLDLQRGPSGDAAPVLNIFGGKLTAYRQLAEKSLKKLLPAMGEERPPWTAGVCLPGGDFADGDFAAFVSECERRWPQLPARLLRRYARQFGSRISLVLDGVSVPADLGEDFGGDVYAAEVRYMQQYEWAQTAGDILWRRTRQGLHVPPGAAAKIDAFLKTSAGA
ncbi:glycerol-3-phosphate dehydrogenase [Granulosicoccaceae sp. 1_MG-2023]|nr:glycerol-3-phosphate dehydrogenase [Granulosicoccaceae sp. 1_MG-2023]